ncbi:hypothetical protein D8S78_16030 [Natrialba swarupiae]|nr:hypothetical protein [Natrialba swarupiae]
MSDNAFYCSAPGTDWGRGGTVALRDCYAANSWVSQYRVAEGLENCVAAVTDDREYRRGRGLWAWSPGPVDVDGCQFAMNGHHYSFVAGANEESRIDVRDTEWDDEFHGGWNTYGDGTVNFKSGSGNDPRNVVPKSVEFGRRRPRDERRVTSRRRRLRRGGRPQRWRRRSGDRRRSDVTPWQAHRRRQRDRRRHGDRIGSHAVAWLSARSILDSRATDGRSHPSVEQ